MMFFLMINQINKLINTAIKCFITYPISKIRLISHLLTLTLAVLILVR